MLHSTASALLLAHYLKGAEVDGLERTASLREESFFLVYYALVEKSRCLSVASFDFFRYLIEQEKVLAA